VKECKQPFNYLFNLVSFRWVQCQLDHLRTLDRDAARRKALEDLPLGLFETYKRILDRLSSVPDRLRIALHSITWLLFEERGLTVRELALLSVSDEQEFNEECCLDDSNTILDYCGGFIKTRTYSPWCGGAQVIVQISHISVRQSFSSEKVGYSEASNVYFLEGERAHSDLTLASISVC
jgi:hypothetical protein